MFFYCQLFAASFSGSLQVLEQIPRAVVVRSRPLLKVRWRYW